MVPKGWKKTHLKCVISGAIKNGYSPLPASTTTGYWVLSLGALTDHGINPLEIKPVVVDEKVKQALLSHGDFLISRSNTPDKVGRSIRFKNEVHNCSYPDLMMRFCVDATKADPDYIEIKLKSTGVRQYYKSCAAGSSSSMVKINKAVVENTPLLLPPFPEQKKIAQILSTWDKAITTTEQLLTNSQQQKKALMQQLLPGRKRLLDKNGVRFSGEWKTTKLSKMGKIVSGGTPDTNTKEFWDGEISWLTPTDVTALKSRFVLSTARTISDAGVKNSSATLLPAGSLMVCTRATIGALAISKTEICTNQGFKNIIPYKNFDVNFIYYTLLYNTPELVRKASGSTFLELSKKDFENIELPCPQLEEEQQKIASVLSTADQEISALQQKLDALKQEKKALMQQLLSGKRRVKVEAAA